ncbi:recombinase family protein [Streptomyces sp. NPDC048438]|uniref:recombinase family protein n=1 Tax=Streptomyces sp. NPDC048438 TaxID=3365551 RepID=UPI0037114099
MRARTGGESCTVRPHVRIGRPYDGCGKCLLGVRRLSRVKLAMSSPERQRENVLTAAASDGAHIIGWADDWEVSGATDPVSRPELGPWLRDERGPYDGLVAAAVDRLGRNVVGCLNTGFRTRDEKKMLAMYGHDGPWELDDPADENRFTMEAWARRWNSARSTARTATPPSRPVQPAVRRANRLAVSYVRKVMGGSTTSNRPRTLPRCYGKSPGAPWPIPRMSLPAVRQLASIARERHRPHVLLRLGSPYWAPEGMLGIAMPADHPVRASVEEHLKAECESRSRVISPPGWSSFGEVPPSPGPHAIPSWALTAPPACLGHCSGERVVLARGLAAPERCPPYRLMPTLALAARA